MTKWMLCLPLPLALATPANATSGLICNTAGPHPIEVGMVIGLTVVSSVVQARLNDDGRDIPVHVAQSWLDDGEIRLDLTDPNAERHELRLRAKSKGDHYDGSIWRHGKRRWVRCLES
jgi:hypothetical protein